MSHDTLLHRLVRPSVRLLARTRVRPNHITALRIASGIGAAVAFAQGTPDAIYWGAALFTASALLDRADGELARLTQRFSRLGHRLDLVADFSADALTFVAMGIGASGGALGESAPWLGVAAGIGTALLFWHLNRPATIRQRVPQSRPIDPDDIILVVPLLACCVGLEPVVVLAGTVAPLVAIVLMARGALAAPPIQAPIRDQAISTPVRDPVPRAQDIVRQVEPTGV